MTTNSSWPEINDNLFTYEDNDDDPDEPRKRQTASDHPDIFTHVFAQKIKAMLKDIKGGLFRDVQGFVFTIEFQKCGLPHIHLLLFLKQHHKIRDAPHVDSIVSAEIPDPVAHPMLYATITKCMMHGLCGPEHLDAACMVDGKCSKHYPKEFCPETRYGDDGYPQYARRDNGRTYTNAKGHTFDNHNVIPYNPYLCARYDCHINVEICASVKAIKYIHKYIYKGHDRATIAVGKDIDEIVDHIGAHYIGPAQGVWHMMEFPMHEEKPSVYRLPVHLKDKHTVNFQEDDDPEIMLDDEARKKTPLTEWFTANAVLPGAKDVTYHDFPQKFVWVKETRKWKTRSKCDVIGRMYFVHPSAGERFYLRTLLTVIKGTESYEDLRTYQDELHPSFKAACFARGLLEDDGEWKKCLAEAGQMQTGHQLRCLFAIILLHCHPAQPHVLWDLNKVNLCDDLRHRLITRGIPDPTDDDVFDYGLHLIELLTIKSGGKRLSDIQDMYTPQQQWATVVDNPILREQLAYDPVEMAERVEDRYPHFNLEQTEAFDRVMDSVNNNRGKIFFLLSAGGGGKTWVCNTIAATVRAQGKVTLCVTSSAIAAHLLDGGRTAHSHFKIPIPIHDASTCNIAKEDHMDGVLHETKIIIWDEAPMQHRYGPEAVDKTIRDLLKDPDQSVEDVPLFGGITVLFLGDFRQTLPVVPKGSRSQIVDASLRRSRLWEHIEVLHLKKNMRLEQTPESVAFAEWLLKVGAGSDLTPDKTIELPNNMRLPQNDVNSLVNAIYPDIDQPGREDKFFLERTILSATNDKVDHLNHVILDTFPGEETVLMSADKVCLKICFFQNGPYLCPE